MKPTFLPIIFLAFLLLMSMSSARELIQNQNLEKNPKHVIDQEEFSLGQFGRGFGKGVGGAVVGGLCNPLCSNPVSCCKDKEQAEFVKGVPHN